jgi:hypothetical protein
MALANLMSQADEPIGPTNGCIDWRHRWDAGNLVGEDQAVIWFDHPPVCVIDWARPGKVRAVSSVESVEAVAEELLKWPKTKKRDLAAMLLADAMAGIADMTKRKKAFEAAAKEAKVWVAYRGP